ncbi:MAG TPA: hypothetical protein VGM39_13335 [Kofleriaceae bacterium]|jgi:hypothetical protein
MNKLSVVLLCVGALACKKGADGAVASGSGSAGSGSAASGGSGSAVGSAAATPNDPKIVVAQVTEFKDKMCACKDPACATKVNDAYSKWGTDISQKMLSDPNPPKTDEATAKQMTEVAMAYGDCMTKAYGAGGAEAGSADVGSGAVAPKVGPGGDPLVAEAIKEMSLVADKMCACKDKACGDTVNDELTKWGEETMKKTAGRVPTPSADEQKKISDAATKFGECMVKLK